MPESTKPQPISKEEVRNLFQLWNSALATEDPDAVAARYSNNAVLLPTVSDVPRNSYALIKDYFVGFLKRKPQGTILESNVTLVTIGRQMSGCMSSLWETTVTR